VGGGADSQIVTEAPAVGTRVTEGSRIAEVSGRPVVALQGRVPMFRALRPGARGRDVLQLEQALLRLHRLAGTPDSVFDVAAQQAVASLYGAIGYPVERGPSVDGTAQGVVVPAGEIVFLPELPLRVEAISVPVGGAVAGDIMTVSRSSVHVVATMAAADAALVGAGMPARIDAGDEPVQFTGRVLRTKRSAASSNDVVVEIVPDDATAARRAVGLPARVTIAVSSTPADALVVPLAAVAAAGDGTSVVRVLRAGTRIEKVVVRPGLVADGFVVVTPVTAGALRTGDEVVVG
jgi:hypothetical protein